MVAATSSVPEWPEDLARVSPLASAHVIAEIVSGLERSVDRPVRPEVLARVSPLWHGHVIASGTCHFRRRSAHA